MNRAPCLRLIAPAAPLPIDINALARAEIRARDWGAVHLAGDQNPPITIWTRRWRSVGAGLRREKGGFQG